MTHCDICKKESQDYALYAVKKRYSDEVVEVCPQCYDSIESMFEEEAAQMQEHAELEVGLWREREADKEVNDAVADKDD